MSPSDLEQAVAKHSFVQGMTPAHIQVLTQCAMFAKFETGQIVFHKGEIANRFYLIQQGKISIETHADGQEGVTVQTIGAGEVLGWSWLFEPYYWHFNACALEPTQAIFFYGTRLREQCEQDREFGYELMRRVTAVVMERLQSTVEQSLKLAGRASER